SSIAIAWRAARSQPVMETTTFHRGVPGRVVAGVCAALAARFGIEVLVVRIAVAAAAFVSGGLVFWLYCVVWAVTPPAAGARAPLTRAVDWLANLFGPVDATSTP